MFYGPSECIFGAPVEEKHSRPELLHKADKFLANMVQLSGRLPLRPKCCSKPTSSEPLLYAPRARTRSTAEWDAQLPPSIYPR